MTKSIYLIIGILSAAPCLFFIYYTARLIYINVTMTPEEAEVHRTGGMLIGAIAFPIAGIVFGAVSVICFRKGLRGTK